MNEKNQAAMDTEWTAGERACAEGDSHHIGHTHAINLAKIGVNYTTSPSTMDRIIRMPMLKTD